MSKLKASALHSAIMFLLLSCVCNVTFPPFGGQLSFSCSYSFKRLFLLFVLIISFRPFSVPFFSCEAHSDAKKARKGIQKAERSSQNRDLSFVSPNGQTFCVKKR
eukprot:TRINITY_DN3301_c3_g1_i2.p1 TRINITY_DN3301_c3_g1~~TRINITY_DN3301_c3_g1_i2.p1  ORF type:complete len:105 (-),score=8.63 TRINITY_DN3301_c3_g1_i2:855-1169(-)